jgi:MFS family permease
MAALELDAATGSGRGRPRGRVRRVSDPEHSGTDVGAGSRSQRRPGLLLAAMTLANAMVLVDQTAVPLALPAIMRHYGVGSQMVQWVLNGSLVTLAALLVLGGQLGDLLGPPSYFYHRDVGVRGRVISQNLAGAAELGLGVILPLLLILNLGMSPGVAGLALLPASVPLILIAPLVGRWYDKAGTRPPMLTEYLCVSRHLVSCWLSAASHSTTGSCCPGWCCTGWACRRPYRQRPGQRQ